MESTKISPSDDARLMTRRMIAEAREDIKLTIAGFLKSANDQLEALSRETDEDYGFEEIRKEVENIKEKAKSHFLKPESESLERKGKTATDQSRQDSLWPVWDMKLEEILENAAIRYKLFDFNQLNKNHQDCLLCLCIFPQDAKIKRRTLINWWIGEGFVKAEDSRTAEEVGEDCFNYLLEANWIDPINTRSSSIVRECTMDPWVRWLVIHLARSKCFFDLNNTGIPSSSPSKSRRACLVFDPLPQPRESKQQQGSGSGSGRVNRIISLLSLFNVDAEHLSAHDLSLMLKEMKSMLVLQLGRWHSLSEHHIEFVDENPESLHRLWLPQQLRYLSLAGISRITQLPASVKDLSHLKVLDLRSCQNLETLGKEIIFLKSLTHLDVSECYMLDQMPKGLGSLSQLQVVKGFMFGSLRSKDPCQLEELTKLEKLKKLSISIGSEAQMLSKEMDNLKEIIGLRSLAITWGKLSLTLSEKNRKQLEDNWTELSYPPNLEKLDLRCFPKPDLWLDPESLKNLKKAVYQRRKSCEARHSQ